MKKITLLISSLVVAVLSVSAYAASVVPMPLSELVKSSDTILVGRCEEIRSYWKDNKIYTDNVIAVEQVIKGDKVTQYVVTTLGGTATHPRLKAPVKMAVPGGARFDQDGQALLLVSTNSEGIHQIVGLTQGKFDVEIDPDSGKRLIPVGQKVVTNEPKEADISDLLFSPFAFDAHTIRIRVRKMELSEMIGLIEAEIAGK